MVNNVEFINNHDGSYDIYFGSRKYSENGVVYHNLINTFGGLMDDDARLNSYLDKYEDIVEAGRKYPLYSAEAAMVLMGCMTMISE